MVGLIKRKEHCRNYMKETLKFICCYSIGSSKRLSNNISDAYISKELSNEINWQPD